MSIVFGSPEAQAILARDQERWRMIREAAAIAEQEGDGLEDALAEVELGVDLLVSEVRRLDRELDECAPRDAQTVGEKLGEAEYGVLVACKKLALYRLALDIQKGKVQP